MKEKVFYSPQRRKDHKGKRKHKPDKPEPKRKSLTQRREEPAKLFFAVPLRLCVFA